MALFGPAEVVAGQVAPHPGFATAFAYVAAVLAPGSAGRRRLGALAAGASERIELEGGVFAIEQVYETRARPEAFFESHRRYVDVQVMVEGQEIMEVLPLDRLTVVQPYHDERDFTKYADAAGGSRLVLGAGEVAVFYPEDGHMPTLRVNDVAALVRKTVVKVPVPGRAP